MKIIELNENGNIWQVPLAIIAKNRAEYYQTKGDNYQEEYDFVMQDDYEGIDWFQNNMDWKDVKDFAIFIPKPNSNKPDDFRNAEMEIKEAKNDK